MASGIKTVLDDINLPGNPEKKMRHKKISKVHSRTSTAGRGRIWVFLSPLCAIHETYIPDERLDVDQTPDNMSRDPEVYKIMDQLIVASNFTENDCYQRLM